MERLKHLLELHRRFHGKVGCPGAEDCYVCKAEDELTKEELEILEHGDPLSGGDYQAMQDVRNAQTNLPQNYHGDTDNLRPPLTINALAAEVMREMDDGE